MSPLSSHTLFTCTSLNASTPGEEGNGSSAEVMEQQVLRENNLEALWQVAGFPEAFRNTKSLPSLQETGMHGSGNWISILFNT